MNIKIQTAGGIAATVCSLAYITGFVVLLTLLSPYYSDTLSPTQKLLFLLEHKSIFQAWNFVIYIVFGISLVILVLTVTQLLKSSSPTMLKIATAFGLIWAGLVIASGMIANTGLQSVATLHETAPSQAPIIWASISAIQEGVGGGIEVVGGLWSLLISWAALRTNRLPRALNYIGLIVGVAGILTVSPTLKELGAIFGLGQILWFVWIGLYLICFDNRKQHIDSLRIQHW